MSYAFAHCEQLVREADKDRFLATLFAPAEHRNALYALYAFDIEVARVPTMAKQAIAGEVRLQWWGEVLERERDGEAHAHPVAWGLIQTLDKYGLMTGPLMQLVEARAFDLYDDPFATTPELERYLDRANAGVVASAAALLGSDAANLAEIIRHAAIARGLRDLLTNFPSRVSRGQLHVPLDLLDRHGVEAADVFAGRSGAGLQAVLADMRALAREHFRAFKQLTPVLSSGAIPAFLPVAPVPLYLDRMDRDDYDPFRTIIAVPQWRRQWALWRAARTWGA